MIFSSIVQLFILLNLIDTLTVNNTFILISNEKDIQLGMEIVFQLKKELNIVILFTDLKKHICGKRRGAWACALVVRLGGVRGFGSQSQEDDAA